MNECCKARSAPFNRESGISIAKDEVSPFFLVLAGNGGPKSLASRIEGGPECVVAPGPIFLSGLHPSIFVEQGRELLDERAAQLLGIHDCHRTRKIARHIVPNADCRKLDARPGLDPVDDLPEMPFQIGAAIRRSG